MPDGLGAFGNGDAWYCPDNAAITNHPVYQSFNKTALSAVDVNSVKSMIAGMPPTAEAAPILNYLRWVLSLANSIA